MRKSLLTGLAILLPFVITVMIIIFLFDILTDPFVGSVEKIMHHFMKNPEIMDRNKGLFVFIGRAISLIVLFFFIVFLGFLARRFIVKWIMKRFHATILRIPYFKRIYRIVEQIIQSFIPADDKRKVFQGTVLVKYPHMKADVMGLLSGDAPHAVCKALNKYNMKTVFVPTAPHPISGFLLIMSSDEIAPLETVSTEQTFKFLLSCGIIDPEEGNNAKT